MKSNVLKASIATAILVVPAVLIMWGTSDIKNRPGLPVMNPQSDSCPAPQGDSIHRVPAFRFTAQSGQAFGSQDLQGKIYVANFFFTRCPDICLQMSSELTRVQAQFATSPDLYLVSFTVDPRHDTVAVLQQYAERYQADPKRWSFLTGDKAQLYELARCGYYIAAKPASSNLATDFIHSDKLVLVDKQGRIRGYYSGTKREEVDRLILEIQVLEKEYQ
jgi:protein SCO1